MYLYLEERNIEWWLDFGQLLAAHRDKVKLPWDNDIDFLIVVRSDDEWESIRNEILNKLDTKFVYALPNKLLRVKKSNWIIDFFRSSRTDEWMDIVMYSNQMSMRSTFFENKKTIYLDGVKFNCPDNLDVYLKIRYGDDWQTPIIKDCRNVRKNPRHDIQFEKI